MVFGKKKAEYEIREQSLLQEVEQLKEECAQNALGKTQLQEALEQACSERETLEAESEKLRTRCVELQAESDQLRARCCELQADNDRVYAGHRGMEEEINFLKYRIGTLDELHESVTFGEWPHDGSFKDYTCRYPFERIEILPRGEVYTCCSGYIKHNYYIGNIYEDHESFEEIWNSDKAKKLRWSVSEGNFEFCQKKCKFFHMQDSEGEDIPIVLKGNFPSYKHWTECVVSTTPKYITLSCDESCNLHCPSCRSHVKALGKAESDMLYDRLIKIVRPMLKDCELLGALGTGELFASNTLSRFYKTLNAWEFPKLKLMIVTNLQLVNEEKWQEFSNLLKIPTKIWVSVDGASKETYEKNRLGGTWERLQDNLGYLCKLRKDSTTHIDWVTLNFVVQDNNYREMEDFVAMAEDLGADAVEFQKLGNWGTFSEEEYREKDVLDKTSPHNKAVMEILRRILEKGSDKIEIIQNII